jgi:pimeloyl-ACP methyl ester carboxylesterase
MLSVTTADGRTLTVREGGDPDGVPIIAHAGTPGSSMLYPPHVKAAEDAGVRLISYDRPGYGGSTRMEGRNAADCAVDVAAVCDALEIGRFCVWGVSGGGPHALATAALLPDRVAAAVVIASVAPYGAEGLDFTAGMGELNVDSFEAILAGEDAHRAQLQRDLDALLASTPETLVEVLLTVLGPADKAALDDELAAFILESSRAGIVPSSDGWFDDDRVFTKPWGFELASIDIPVLYWHGEQDRLVPLSHGEWLVARIPGVEARLTPEDGHLTVLTQRYGEIQGWLLERFND